MSSIRAELPNAALARNCVVKNRRIASFDLFKVLAIFAVVVIHSQPFSPKSDYVRDSTIAVVVNLCCRFAVPFFFMVSGYFFAERVRKGNRPIAIFRKSAKRLLSVYLMWCFFYLWVPLNHLDTLRESWIAAIVENWQHYIQFGWGLFLTGTYDVLWFLPALVIGLLILTLSYRFRWRKYLVHLSIALYGVGLILGSYSALWHSGGASDLAFNTRNGPFFGTPFVVIGWLIYERQRVNKKKIGTVWAVAIALSGLLLQFIEANWLMSRDSLPNGNFDYLIGTAIFSVGIFLLALSNPYLAEGWPILKWSQYTLGVFLFHPIVLNVVKFVGSSYSNALVEIGEPIAIYFLSLVIVFLAARYLPVKKWVM